MLLCGEILCVSSFVSQKEKSAVITQYTNSHIHIQYSTFYTEACSKQTNTIQPTHNLCADSHAGKAVVGWQPFTVLNRPTQQP